MLTNPQKAALERGLAAANEVLPRLDFLRELGEIDPQLKQRHDELRAQRDYLYTLTTTALDMHRRATNGR